MRFSMMFDSPVDQQRRADRKATDRVGTDRQLFQFIAAIVFTNARKTG
jgi:hypothetical protein